jgi:hypothetical protein
MPWVKGQSGNPAGPRPRDFEAALRRALLRADPKTKATDLDNIAKALIAKALEGDVPAIKEVADRSDGKVAQAVEHSGENGGPIQSHVTVSLVSAAKG